MLVRSKFRVFVFYIDEIAAADRDHLWRWVKDFSLDRECFFITRDDGLYEIHEHCSHLISYKVQLPNLMLIRFIMEKGFSLEEIAFVSDSLSFIKNALNSLCYTILIQSKPLSYDYIGGYIPDMICSSLEALSENLELGKLRYCGENAFNNMGDLIPRGLMIRLYYSNGSDCFPIIAAGRYFGYKHFLSHFDLFSYAIRSNKRSGKLRRKFDESFIDIWYRMIDVIIKKYRLSEAAICNVPDKPGSNCKFCSITSTISRLLGIDDISCNFLCVRNYGENKLKNQEDRAESVRESFTYSGSLEGKTVFLIDDIVTTGSTIAECVSVLRANGAKAVIAVVLGINQYDRKYMVYDSMLSDSAKDAGIRYNSGTLAPFYKWPDKTESILDAFSKIFTELNQEILGMNAIADDEHMF